MPKIVVGPINKGLKSDRTAFVIDNDSFPTLINAYQWRGRLKRKRGTSLLGRLQRFFDSTNVSYNTGSTTILLDGAGSGNLLSGFSLETGGNIVPGSVTITAGGVFTDPAEDGTLSPSGSINYATGGITIAAAAGLNASATFIYTPTLPVMGLEDFAIVSAQFPGTIAFDTTYAYNIVTSDPYPIYSVSFYKNPAADAVNMPGYVPKTNETPITWNGQDYQQFWSVNYQGALWVTNGIEVPFDPANVGMQFKAITGVAIVAAGPPAIVTLTIVNHGLVKGDFVFINEIVGMTGINFQTGYVVSNDPQAANTVDVELPFATVGGAYVSGGIAQYLTNRSSTTKDCIRFYDGDPTDGNPTSPGLTGNKGWVNFMPPLSQSTFSISDLPPAQYYLAGARMIQNFKDRLLFLGPVVQTSTGTPIYLQDTIIYSQNGTPYYTSSFTGDVDLPTTVFHPLLLPVNQTGSANAYFSDQTGFGGFIQAGLEQPIITSATNEDVLMVGFQTIQTRVIYTGNDILPFNFFLVNSELGSGSTFSAINLDRGVITRGSRGYVISSQVEARRIDLEIPDQAFETQLVNNGFERFTAQRDYINEWVYFTYPGNNINYIFPNTTLQYNYRDESWALFYETYTTYGSFKKQTGFIWSTVGNTYETWIDWAIPWDAGESTLLQPLVIAGNQQGFVMVRDGDTGEGTSLQITSFSGNQVFSQDHCLNDEDFIVISGCLGAVGAQVNGKVFQVYDTSDSSFRLNPSISAGAYSGGGLITRLYRPFIQSKQFPVAWEIARKSRLGVQQYLLTTTETAQMTLLIFLSQDGSNPYNDGPVVPSLSSDNNGLIYSTVLYTCPESTNLGLTPANINLNMVTAQSQSQIWHRINTSLLGDTIQIGFTLSDEQMRDETLDNQTAEIEIHGFVLDVTPSQLLA